MEYQIDKDLLNKQIGMLGSLLERKGFHDGFILSDAPIRDLRAALMDLSTPNAENASKDNFPGYIPLRFVLEKDRSGSSECLFNLTYGKIKGFSLKNYDILRKNSEGLIVFKKNFPIGSMLQMDSCNNVGREVQKLKAVELVKQRIPYNGVPLPTEISRQQIYDKIEAFSKVLHDKGYNGAYKLFARLPYRGADSGILPELLKAYVTPFISANKQPDMFPVSVCTTENRNGSSVRFDFKIVCNAKTELQPALMEISNIKHNGKYTKTKDLPIYSLKDIPNKPDAVLMVESNHKKNKRPKL